MKWLALTLIISMAASNAYAACDLNDLHFGKNKKAVSQKYRVDDLLLDGNKLYVEAPVRSTELCDDLPADTETLMVFIDSKFVKVIMRKTDSISSLFDVAQSEFGEVRLPDDFDAEDPNFQNHWTENDKFVVFYSVQKENETNVEVLEITSTKHDKLFKEAYMAEENLINTRGIE